jgi:hypothetical protein
MWRPFLESFAAFSPTVWECIANKQTNRQTNILPYIYTSGGTRWWTDCGCLYFVSISSFLAVQKPLIGYFLQRIILPSYTFHIHQCTLAYPFSTFRRRFLQLLTSHDINNISVVSKGERREIPLVSAQTAFGRLRYRPAAKVDAH